MGCGGGWGGRGGRGSPRGDMGWGWGGRFGSKGMGGWGVGDDIVFFGYGGGGWYKLWVVLLSGGLEVAEVLDNSECWIEAYEGAQMLLYFCV